MSIQELVEAMKYAYANGYRVFGIRTIEKCAGLLNVGDSVPDSYNWDHENDVSTRETTGETLGGACAIAIDTSCLFLDGEDDEDVAAEIEKAIKASACYYGDEVLLIGGKFGYEYGEDEGEIIIESADVIGIVT